MNLKQDRDEWLMAQLASGHREHLEPLIRRYAGPLLTFIRRMVGDRHGSEELFQEVFLAVWTKRRQYQFPRPFKAWLYAIALNKCRAAFRTRAAPATVALDDDSPVTPSAHEPSPADKAVATETAALVTTAVTRLPPQQRAVVVLRIWDGLSYAEIADVVGRTEGQRTVEVLEHIGTPETRQGLKDLTSAPQKPELAQEAKEAFERLARANSDIP